MGEKEEHPLVSFKEGMEHRKQMDFLENRLMEKEKTIISIDCKGEAYDNQPGPS